MLGSRLEPLRQELVDTLGADRVLADPDTTAGRRTDWTGRFGGYRALVVRPADAAEVATVLGRSRDRGIAVVPQGGNTGLVGGSVPGAHDAVILSTERLDELGDVDHRTGQVTAGAGVTLGALAAHLAGTGWRYAIDIGARDTATVGGTVATNAGGMRVFRHGPTRQQIVGLEYVTVDGEVVSRLDGITKDNTGFHLDGLLCGSEGTLAVVTAARLRLLADAPATATALVALASRREAFDAAWRLRRAGGSSEVIEYLSGSCLRLVSDRLDLPVPVEGEALLLVEAAGSVDPTDELATALEVTGLAHVPVAVASDARTRGELWRLRDDLTAAIATLGTVLKYDVSVPAPSLDTFCAEVESTIGSSVRGAACWLFGHVCDDNVHVNVTGAADRAAEVDDLVLGAVARHRGSISAEHGIGRAKAAHLGLSRSAGEIRLMRAVKAAFDPDGILNPGVILG